VREKTASRSDGRKISGRVGSNGLEQANSWNLKAKSNSAQLLIHLLSAILPLRQVKYVYLLKILQNAHCFDLPLMDFSLLVSGEHTFVLRLYLVANNPKNGSRSSLELAIFFKTQPLASIDDFTIWVRCGVVQNR
jgi:hypothetical protein